jgi:hypothetical protein
MLSPAVMRLALTPSADRTRQPAPTPGESREPGLATDALGPSPNIDRSAPLKAALQAMGWSHHLGGDGRASVPVRVRL